MSGALAMISTDEGGSKVSRWLALSLSVVALSLSAGCSSTTADRVARDVHTVEAEKTPDKLLARGLAFARIGDQTRAEQYLSAALDGGADPGVVLPNLIRVCVDGHRYRVAVDYAMTQLDKHPDDVRLRFVVAELRAALEDNNGARKDLERVLESDPKNAPARFAYARLLRDGFGEVLAADKEFRTYLALAPTGEHADEANASLLHIIAVPAAGSRPVRVQPPGARHL